MKKQILGLIATGLLAGPMAANASIVWDWSFAGEAGTFTTSGTASGGTAAAGNYVLSDFSVTSSASGGLIGSVLGGQYITTHFGNAQPYSLDWSGSAVTQWNQSGINLFDWWTFGPTNFAYTYFFGWKTGNINDATQAAFYTGDLNTESSTVSVKVQSATSVPEPASLSLLGLGLAGIGFMRRRKAS